MRGTYRRSRNPQSGFAVSSEFLLIAVIVVSGLVTGWVQFRDESLSEIKDTMAAIDAWVVGASSTFEPYAQLWIKGGTVADEVTPAAVTEYSQKPDCVASDTGVTCGAVGTWFATGTVTPYYGTAPNPAASEENVF